MVVVPQQTSNMMNSISSFSDNYDVKEELGK